MEVQAQSFKTIEANNLNLENHNQDWGLSAPDDFPRLFSKTIRISPSNIQSEYSFERLQNI